MAAFVASAFISSRLVQLNSILYGTPLKHTARLQRIQHAVARVVLYQHSRTSPLSSNKLLKQLHWLPIEWRIRFKLAHTSPPYLPDLLQHHEPKEVSALIQFSSALSPPPQINIWISCFSFFCSESLEFITCQYSVTSYFQTSFKDN